MAIYINSNKEVKKICVNINCEKKNITSAWVNRDGVPAKVFGQLENGNPDEIAPTDAISYWTYTLNNDNNTIMLRTYSVNSPETNVIIYANYIIKGNIYKTQIAPNMNVGYLFKDCKNIKSITFSNNIDTSNVTQTNSIFKGCSSLINLNLGSLDMCNVTNAYAMFKDCSSLTSLDLSGLNTSNLTYANSMFKGCNSLINLDLKGIDTSNIYDMAEMFSGCSSLTSLDLSSFNTIKVKNMRNMFVNDQKLTTIYVSNSIWTTANADITNMFYNCGTSSVTYK